MSARCLAALGVIAIFWFDPAANPALSRPKIVGVANIAFRVASLETARGFYGKVLGYREAFTIKESSGGPHLTCYKVNDRQYIQVSAIPLDAKTDKLIHIGFETTGARELRDYLAGENIAVPDKIQPGPDGNLSFTVSDPDGNPVEFVQYLPDSIQSRSRGQFLAEGRVSDHIFHVGISAKNRAATDHFYKDILGFRPLMEVDLGRAREIALLVPDGNEFIEYALYNSPQPLPPMILGIMNHVCLDVPDIQATYQAVMDRGYHPPHPPALAQAGLWQLNLLDPDGSRIEIMSRKPSRKELR